MTIPTEPIGSILAARERTEQELLQAKESLRKQSEWLRLTLASIGDAVIATDVEGRVTFMNGVAESLTGWPQAEAVDRPLSEVFCIVNEDTRLPVENPALRAMREGMVVGLANHTILIARDGKERPIDDSAAPMRGNDGAVVGAVLVFRDGPSAGGRRRTRRGWRPLWSRPRTPSSASPLRASSFPGTSGRSGSSAIRPPRPWVSRSP